MFKRIVVKAISVLALASMALPGCGGKSFSTKDIQGNWEYTHYLTKDGTEQPVEEADRALIVIKESTLSTYNLQRGSLDVLKYALSGDTISIIINEKEEQRPLLIVDSVTASQLQLKAADESGVEESMKGATAVLQRRTDEAANALIKK